MPKLVKLTMICVCFALLFLPDSIRGISTKLIMKFALICIPVMLICFIGEWAQEEHLKKRKMEEDKENKLKELELQEQERQRQKEIQEKERLQKEKDKQEKIENYFKSFDLCDLEEKELLLEFYICQETSLVAEYEQRQIAEAMNLKGIKIFGTNDGAKKIITTPKGLELINKYFERDKEKYFNFLNLLDDKSLIFLRAFYEENYERVKPHKGYKKIALNVIDKFCDNGFNEIYLSPSEECVVIPKLYLAYIIKYFKNKEEVI